MEKNLFDIVREFSSHEFEIQTYWDTDEKEEENEEQDQNKEQKENEKQDQNEQTSEELEKDEGDEENAYKIQVKQNQSVFKIHGLNPDDFPSFPSLVQEKGQKIKVKDMLEVIDKTLYCVSLDESRYHLTGVFLDQVERGKYRFVATDGHRMSFIDIQGEYNKEFPKEGIIIPKKGLQEVKKMLSSAKKGNIWDSL